MKAWQGKVALVTNCGSDVGVAIIEELSNNGIATIGFGKTKEIVDAFPNKKSKDEHKGQIILCKCDITNIKELTSAIKKVTGAYGGIDILINNALCTEGTLIGDVDMNKIRTEMKSNVLSTVALVRLVASTMIEKKGRSHIMIVNDVFNDQELSSKTMTRATKNAVYCTNELLRLELRYLKANVKTTILDCSQFMKGDDEDNDYSQKIESVTKVITAVLGTPENLHIHEIAVD